MSSKGSILLKILLIILLLGEVISAQENLQNKPETVQQRIGAPIILDKDTLFNLYTGVGPFSTKRANEISRLLKTLVDNESYKTDSVKTFFRDGVALIKYGSLTIMTLTPDDALANGRSIAELSAEYMSLIKKNIILIKNAYSQKSILEKILFVSVFFIGFFLLMWLNRFVFPKLYSLLEKLEGKIFKAVRIGKFEILKGSALLDLAIILTKGLRLFITLAAIYFLIVFTVTNLPWTRHWYIQPILRGILLFVFVSVVAYVSVKGTNLTYRYFTLKFHRWKGSLIKSFRFKSIEILSEDKAVDMLNFVAKGLRIFIWIIIGYFYITIVFSLFTFSQTWSAKLIDYILGPLNTVFMSIIKFLPNLFFIIVIVFVFNYVLKFVKYFFGEIEKENLKIPGFHVDWASPTYKIVRFLVIVLAVIIVFPYLPGSDSEAFRGISVFLGVLFSFGSSSAISNIVAGTVLTYMRPFRIGDRVKIADTVGDVIEKTLLVTRVRTIKNVEITIPNSMVLGSHIINYSSASKETGLILHTSVTIGYDAPWRQIHQLLITAAQETENILKEPLPFVLQTSLDDFYVSYEINAYTDKPGIMVNTYSQLHSKIQDKFNEAGVEIMSPHYNAVRDGNQTTVPPEHLSKDYIAPSFRLFGVNIFGDKSKSKE